MRHVIPVSGKDSLATAIVQTEREPHLEYEYIFNDTGCELPEVYDWLDEVENKTGWQIKRIPGYLEAIIHRFDFLPSQMDRYCTRMAKIKPMEREYKDEDAIYVYYGLRADEHRVGAYKSDLVTPVYPLVELGLTLSDVWRLLTERDLLPPTFFWPSLYYRVCELLGQQRWMIDELEQWEFQMLFAGRSRSNCYFCFYQRQYEQAWLLGAHPDYFWKACWMERTIGGDGFTWRQGFYLDNKVINERNRILDRRAKEVCKFIRARFNTNLFGLLVDSEIAATSCGLLCGK